METKTTKSPIKKVKLIIQLIVLFAIFSFVGFLIMDKLLLPLSVGAYSSDIKVPEVVGMSETEAKIFLEKMDLKMVVDTRDHSSKYGLDTIFFQNPPVNNFVKKNRRIRVNVSKGGQIVTVPFLQGLSENSAKSRIRKYGIALGRIFTQNHDSLPEGVVIKSEPQVNSDIMRDSQIDIWISKGPKYKSIKVPNFIGSGRNSAIMESQKLGLKIGTIKKVVVDSVLPETVIQQSIGTGAEVGTGAIINFTISSMD